MSKVTKCFIGVGIITVGLIIAFEVDDKINAHKEVDYLKSKNAEYHLKINELEKKNEELMDRLKKFVNEDCE